MISAETRMFAELLKREFEYCRTRQQFEKEFPSNNEEWVKGVVFIGHIFLETIDEMIKRYSK